MMNSGFNIDDDDDFAPNPFRSGGNDDFYSTPNPQQQQQFGNQMQQQPQYNQQQPQYNQQQQQQYNQQQQHFNQQQPPQQFQQQQQFQQNQQFQQQQQQQFQQPDPQSGMTGNFQMPAPQNRAPAQNPVYLSGQMDQNAAQNKNNYGATRDVPSTPFSIFSWRGLLSCMRIDTYVQYFDVDTVDITGRLKAALFKFHEPDQFRTAVIGDTSGIPEGQDPGMPHDPTTAGLQTVPNGRKGPDLYGPVWISFTLMFILGVTSNLSAYMHHKRHFKHVGADVEIETFEYDINHLIRAGSIVMTFCLFVPTGFWFVTHCLGMPAIPWAMWVCCYGYSAVPITAGALTAWWFPFSFWHWLVLAAATAASGMLVVRNLSTPLLSQDTESHAKAAPLILAMLGVHFVYMCVLKYSFFTHDY